MLGIGAHMGLPDVLKVVVVRGGTTPFDFSQHTAVAGEAIEEVRPGVRDEPILRSEHDLLTERQLLAKQTGHDGLDSATIRAVHVGEVDISCRKAHVLE